MTNLNELITQIEAVAFEVQFTVVSNFKIMLKVLERNEIIEQLVQAIRDNQENALTILQRIETLLNNDVEDDVMHPHDISVLVYLFALNAVDYPNLTLSAIEKIGQTQCLYWAVKYAESILQTVTSEAKTTS